MNKPTKTPLLVLIASVVVVATAYVSTNYHSAVSSQGYISEEKLAYLRDKYETKKAIPKRYDQPKEAMQFYVMQRKPLAGTELPFERYREAMQRMEKMSKTSISKRRNVVNGALEVTEDQAAWKNLGPGNIGGRTRTMLIDPVNPDIMYAAGVAGGIWKTVNGGARWRPLDDMMANLAVSTLAMDPQDTRILYAGTGEGYFNGDSLRGDGIFFSRNGGKTWRQIRATANNSNFHYVNKLRIHPDDSRQLFAATRTGIWHSGNRGRSWQRVYNPGESRAGCLDLVIRSDGTPNLIAACGSFDGDGRIIRSTDGGANWQQVLREDHMARSTLAIAPSNQDIIYALTASADPNSPLEDGLHGVFKSIDGGATWDAMVRNTDSNKLNTTLLTNPVFAFLQDCFGPDARNQFFNQGWYDNIIAVDPVNADIVWAGGVDLFRSDDGGKNWDLASFWWFDNDDPQFVHADQHALVFHPDYDGVNNKTLFVGNDGGVFKTEDTSAGLVGGFPFLCGAPQPGTISWSNLNNNYAVTQFYHGTAFPGGSTYFGGTQDNGTNLGTDIEGVDGWREISGGDGGYVAVDPTNTDVLFVEFTRLSLRKSIDGGKTFTRATSGIDGGGFLFITPFTMAPSDPQTLWLGGDTLWRTKDQANSWSRGSPLTPKETPRGDRFVHNSISAIAVSAKSTTKVVAGDNRGNIYFNTDADNASGDTPWNISRPTEGFVSSVAFDPQNDHIIYATYSTFDINHVWRSLDGGKHWRAIDRLNREDGIPNIPAHSLAVHPSFSNVIFVGTELGVFVSEDRGESWAVANEGFANTIVETLFVNRDELFAFTHGRGAYRVPLPQDDDEYLESGAGGN